MFSRFKSQKSWSNPLKPSCPHDFSIRCSSHFFGQKTARTYLEKPRTAVGWRGLISDPTLSGAEDVPRGLALGRRVLLDVLAAGLPTAVEFLDPLVACPGGVCCG
jgi:hypothetical protein